MKFITIFSKNHQYTLNALAIGALGVFSCLALVACGGGDDSKTAHSPAAVSATPLGLSGGTVSVLGRAVLEVPPGLLVGDSKVMVTIADERQTQSDTLSKTIRIDWSQAKMSVDTAKGFTVHIPTDAAMQAGLEQQPVIPFTSEYLRSNGAMALIQDVASN
ncbi:MAG: hypothetical protein ORN28_07950, partial [Rhodoferax sp.]|nr:hypothetical protein [Rhodoferax sp.]